MDARLTPLLLALGTATVGGLGKIFFSWLANRLSRKKWDKMYQASGASPSQGAPPDVFQAVTKPPLSASTLDHVVDVTRTQAKQVLLEAELAEAQEALRRLRRSLDQSTHELTDSKAEVVALRTAKVELESAQRELTAHAEQLLEENRRLRMEAEINEQRDRRTDLADMGRRRFAVDTRDPLPAPPGRKGLRKGDKY